MDCSAPGSPIAYKATSPTSFPITLCFAHPVPITLTFLLFLKHTTTLVIICTHRLNIISMQMLNLLIHLPTCFFETASGYTHCVYKASQVRSPYGSTNQTLQKGAVFSSPASKQLPASTVLQSTISKLPNPATFSSTEVLICPFLFFSLFRVLCLSCLTHA